MPSMSNRTPWQVTVTGEDDVGSAIPFILEFAGPPSAFGEGDRDLVGSGQVGRDAHSRGFLSAEDLVIAH